MSPPEVYERPAAYYVDQQLDFGDSETQIEVGRPMFVIDALNHYLLSLPTKLLLLNWQALDHSLPDENRALLQDYLALNEMRSVKVRHNEWAPLGELERLHANEEVGIVYRYTLGLYSWLQYTLLPGRLLAGLPIIGLGDHFNPFTNTIHVYSSDPTILLHEAGHAKDYLQQGSKGTMALMRILPGVDLLQEASASSDAIQYLYCIGDTKNELRSYRTLLPAYATYIAGYIPGGLYVFLPIVAAGHVSGRVHALRRRDQLDDDGFGPDWQRRRFLPEWCERPSRNMNMEWP